MTIPELPNFIANKWPELGFWHRFVCHMTDYTVYEDSVPSHFDTETK